MKKIAIKELTIKMKGWSVTEAKTMTTGLGQAVLQQVVQQLKAQGPVRSQTIDHIKVAPIRLASKTSPQEQRARSAKTIATAVGRAVNEGSHHG